MKYPRMNHFLIFNRINEDTYEIENYLTKEKWEMSIYMVRFLTKLNGRRNPYTIDSSLDKSFVDQLLKVLKDEGMFYSDKRIILMGLGYVLCTVYIPQIRKIHKILAKIFNVLLMSLCLPVFVLGIYILIQGLYQDIYGSFWILKGYLLGAVSGLIFHEIAHANACLAYGGHVFEFGVMLYWFIPGAYAMIEYDKIKNQFKRVQIDAAGVEMNLFLCGFFLCICPFRWIDSSVLICASFINFWVAVLNLSLIEGMDGMNIFSELLGVEELVVKAKGLIFSKKRKDIMRKRGISGYIIVIACYLIVIFQILLPIILLLNTVSWIGFFIN